MPSVNDVMWRQGLEEPREEQGTPPIPAGPLQNWGPSSRMLIFAFSTSSTKTTVA